MKIGDRVRVERGNSPWLTKAGTLSRTRDTGFPHAPERTHYIEFEFKFDSPAGYGGRGSLVGAWFDPADLEPER
jgi:hypothetical protein